MSTLRKNKIIFLVGPTAVGKSEIAVDLAKKINAEIISCDSMQVYKGMDIGTQKPPLDLRKKVKHHMLDILSPDKEFSAADFRKRALRIIGALHKKGKIPLFAGGTGLYMKALLNGLFPSPPKNEALRRRLYKEAKKYGSAQLHEKLKNIDPATADKIHPNDTKKIIRALEICYTTKKTVSEMRERTPRPLSDKYDVRIIGLIRPREELYRRIDERVDRMFEQGLLDEVRRLADKKLSITARQAIGYKEALSYLRKQVSIKRMDSRLRGNDSMGIYPDKDLEELKELIKKNTRRYAKRQLTWFGADKRIKWKKLY